MKIKTNLRAGSGSSSTDSSTSTSSGGTKSGGANSGGVNSNKPSNVVVYYAPVGRCVGL